MSSTTDRPLEEPAEEPFAEHFVLGRPLGRGGLADVHRALDLRTGRTVAVRVLRDELRDEPGVAEVFCAGALAAARVSHPHVLTVHEVVVDHDPPYVVTDVVDGLDLEDVLRRDGPLAPRRVVRLMRQIAGAVDALHAAGVVHGDLKPSNVLVAPLDRGEEHAWVIDVAAEQPGDDPAGEQGDRPVLVTAAYLAPERRRGGAGTPASDVYALGCLALELLTGERPRPRGGPGLPDGSGVELDDVRGGPGPGVLAVIGAAVARSPARRPTSAADLVDRLEAAVGDPDAPVPRRRVALVGAAGLVALLLAAGWFARVLVDHREPARIPGPEAVLLDGSMRWQERRGFRVAIPRGWRSETDDLRASDARWVNRWVQPGTNRFVEIDRLEPRTTTYSQNAGFLDQTRRGTPYYERVSMEETVVAGRGAISWAFRDREGDQIVTRYELLFDRGIEGYAILVGGDASFSALSTFARRIGETLETTSAGAATDASGNLVGDDG